MNRKSIEVLETVVKAIVAHPEDVKVTESVDEMGILLTLDINKEDMGRIIGRTGNTAKAIRTIIRVIGMTEGARVSIKISEPSQ